MNVPGIWDSMLRRCPRRDGLPEGDVEVLTWDGKQFQIGAYDDEGQEWYDPGSLNALPDRVELWWVLPDPPEG